MSHQTNKNQTFPAFTYGNLVIEKKTERNPNENEIPYFLRQG